MNLLDQGLRAWIWFALTIAVIMTGAQALYFQTSFALFTIAFAAKCAFHSMLTAQMCFRSRSLVLLLGCTRSIAGPALRGLFALAAVVAAIDWIVQQKSKYFFVDMGLDAWLGFCAMIALGAAMPDCRCPRLPGDQGSFHVRQLLISNKTSAKRAVDATVACLSGASVVLGQHFPVAAATKLMDAAHEAGDLHMLMMPDTVSQHSDGALQERRGHVMLLRQKPAAVRSMLFTGMMTHTRRQQLINQFHQGADERRHRTDGTGSDVDVDVEAGCVGTGAHSVVELLASGPGEQALKQWANGPTQRGMNTCSSSFGLRNLNRRICQPELSVLASCVPVACEGRGVTGIRHVWVVSAAMRPWVQTEDSLELMSVLLQFISDLAAQRRADDGDGLTAAAVGAEGGQMVSSVKSGGRSGTNTHLVDNPMQQRLMARSTSSAAQKGPTDASSPPRTPAQSIDTSDSEGDDGMGHGIGAGASKFQSVRPPTGSVDTPHASSSIRKRSLTRTPGGGQSDVAGGCVAGGGGEQTRGNSNGSHQRPMASQNQASAAGTGGTDTSTHAGAGSTARTWQPMQLNHHDLSDAYRNYADFPAFSGRSYCNRSPAVRAVLSRLKCPVILSVDTCETRGALSTTLLKDAGFVSGAVAAQTVRGMCCADSCLWHNVRGRPVTRGIMYVYSPPSQAGNGSLEVTAAQAVDHPTCSLPAAGGEAVTVYKPLEMACRVR